MHHYTPAELDIHTQAENFHQADGPPRIKRMLERPFGSVRWRDDAPEPGMSEILPITST